jgi:predicted amidohydrolase
MSELSTINLTVALLQIMPPDSQNETKFIAKGEEYCRRAAEQGADIALFPELWNVGYTFPIEHSKKDIEAWNKRPVTKNSSFVLFFQELSKELNMAIAITYLEDYAPGHRPRNSVTLFNRHGIEVLHYSKVHTCDFGDEILTEPGDEFRVGTLSTKVGDIKIGAMICFDREMPESARILMLKSAEIILTPNASFLHKAQLEQFSTRAFENMVGVAMTNYPAPKYNGSSIAFSPIIENKTEQIDNCLVKADKDEGLYFCEFNISAMRKWRNQKIWGNNYRRPNAYRKLIQEDV